MRGVDDRSHERSLSIGQTLLIPALLVSGLLGVWIAASDAWLRAVAPSHAYGLLAFAAFDLVLVLAVIVVPKPGFVGALLVSLIQVLAMAGDALTFTPSGTLRAAFRAYLLGDTSFVVLLGIQLVVAGITATAIAWPHGTRDQKQFDQTKHRKMLS